MNKRHYEHTLPNIRGSLSNTYETLNDEILASALLDRLLYRCEVIKFTGSSYRLENRQTIFKTTTGTRNELMKP